MKLILLGIVAWVSFIEIMTAMGTHTIKGYIVALVLWYIYIFKVLFKEEDTYYIRIRKKKD